MCRSLRTHCGFTPDGTSDEWWQALRGGRPSGVIGLHYAEEAPPLRAASPDDPIGPPPTVDVGLEPSEELPALAERLRAAGYADVVVEEDNGLVRVQTTDPGSPCLEILPTT